MAENRGTVVYRPEETMLDVPQVAHGPAGHSRKGSLGALVTAWRFGPRDPHLVGALLRFFIADA